MTEALKAGGLRGALAICCDDVRQEITGKLIYVGVYGGRMLVDSFPAALSQLTIVALAWCSIDDPFKKLTFRVIQNETVLIEESVDEAQLADIMTKKKKDQSELEDPSDRILISRVFRLVPLILDEPCKLLVRVATESEELRAGGVRVVLQQQKPEGSGSAS